MNCEFQKTTYLPMKFTVKLWLKALLSTYNYVFIHSVIKLNYRKLSAYLRKFFDSV